ncbi:hypothetical protein NMY22_g14994 [Coprinellus aureogranulatus]|nr:hypothetical protein NMY22_g14994 [Coprinellus aureogranulatus]
MLGYLTATAGMGLSIITVLKAQAPSIPNSTIASPLTFSSSKAIYLLAMVEERGGPRRPQEAVSPAAWLTDIETPDNSSLVEECRKILARLPPDGERFNLSIPGASLYPPELKAFLGETWLDDSAIYAGCRYIQHHLANPSIAFADTFHLTMLQRDRERSPQYSAHTELDESILIGAAQPVTQVFLPLHVYGAHWTLFHLDLELGTYSYADCLWGDETPPPEEMDLILWWLRGLDVDTDLLRHVPFPVPLPQQKDSSSCGVIVLSLMAHLLLGYEPWSQECSARDRLRWFIRLGAQVPDDESDMEDVPASATGSRFDDPDDSDDSDWERISRPGSPSSSGGHSLGSFPATTPSSPSTSHSTLSAFSSFNSSTLGKRSEKSPSSYHSLLSSDDDSDLSDSAESRQRKRRRCSGPREGTSWARQKELKARSKDKHFKAHDMKLSNFRTKILAIDEHAEFQADDLNAVRCSACTQWVFMRALYDTLRFTEHRKSKKCQGVQSTGLVTKSLWSLGFVYKKAARSTSTCMVPVPCPALTRQSDPRIDNYLSRTSVQFGGAPSRFVITRELFGPDARWSELSKKRQRMVVRREKVLALWRNAHDIEAVFSTQCESTVYAGGEADPPPCEACHALHKLHTFQVAIRRPMPLEKNMKFVPKAYRCSQLGEIYLRYTGVRELMEKEDGKSPWLKFAVGVVDGKYDCDVLFGMVEAFVAKADRLARGKSLRNLKYSGAFSDFCDVLACLSPVGYRTFQEHFGGRSMESMRRIRSKGPRFQPGFSRENIVAVADLLTKYDYHGPLALSWDDTELAPAISIYQESKDICVVIGGGDDVVRVGPNDSIDDVLANARLNKATKLRLWLLTIPLPRIPPILVAAVARHSSGTAVELKRMHDRVVEMLHMHDIFPVSGASDGTETERLLQELISQAAPSSKTYTIPNSHSNSAIISLDIPLVDGQHPFVAVQDSKHALKTARNQILTGARLLTIGNDVLHYRQLHEAAYAGSALLTADVGPGLDRQDDRAAARVFSAKMLEFNLANNPSQRALSVYLFILGELVDAWQNRKISHCARAKMVMRARFFLMTWRSHIDAHPEHSVHTNFISRESFGIFITLCDSLLALMVVHRGYHAHCSFCPWLHSTEPCEHVFGVIRKIKPDFTYADMLAAERKIAVLIAGAFRNLTPEQKANATAAGYHHTYFDAHGIDLIELARMPTDQEFARASDAAFQEVVYLMAYLGIATKTVLPMYVAPPSRQPLRPFPAPQRSVASLLSLFDNTWRERDAAKNDLPDMTSEHISTIRDFLSSACVDITSISPSPGVSAPATALDPLDALQLCSANTLRIRRTENAPVTMEMNMRTLNRACVEGLTLREQLTAKLRDMAVEVAKEGRQSGGVGRQVRHTGTFAGHLTATQAETKATVKGVAANKFLQLRDQALSPLRGRVHESFASANINQINPLSHGQFIIALFPSSKEVMEVFLGEVITIYSRGNGKNAKHEWVTRIESLGVASYIYVRKFVPLAGDSVFTSLSCQQLTTSTYIQVPRTHLLFSLGSYSITRGQPIVVDGCDFDTVNLCSASTVLYSTLRSHQGVVSTCIRNLQALMAGRDTASVSVFLKEESEESDGSDLND